jgi:hypothetical protein
MNMKRSTTQPLFLPFLLAGLFLLLPGAGFEPACVQAEGCSAPDWSAGVQYARGTLVTHQLHEWTAKRSSVDVEPGTHKPTWRDLGTCSSEPPPPPPPSGDPTPMQILGVWHAGNHYADWALPRTFPEFDEANHWIIDRGDGSGLPSVNLVVLSFLHPMQVLNMTEGEPWTGVPVGMTEDIVNYFKEEGIRVMMSIGGITYTDAWDEALTANATQFGKNAAAIASYFGVGIEIDYERNTDANLIDLQAFVDAYRSVHAFDPTGVNHAARLTIDLAAGGRYLQELNHYATINWLDNDHPVLDYANAMVHRKSGSPDNWQEHVDGMPTYNPVIPPKAPNKFTGGLYIKGNMANCTNFYSSEQWQHSDYLHTVLPSGAGTTSGMLGYMFWAAEYPSARKNYVATVPPNTCENGMGEAAIIFDIPIPMEEFRPN